MSTLEVALAFWSNLRGMLVGAAIICGIATFCAAIVWGIHKDLEEYPSLKASSEKTARTALMIGKRTGAICLVAALLACVPDADDIWKVRVGLLKLEVVSPENVKALGQHAEQIVKQLECKHLNVNCPKPEKAP